jgi:CRISPR-associated protein Csm3
MLGRLTDIIEIKGILKIETGLHIGAGDLEMHIGGIDNPVIKHPVTGQPYIPGSSIKGKMRAMLEWRTGAITDGKPLSLRDREKPGVEPILKLFGVGGGDTDEKIGPSRLSVADAVLTEDLSRPGNNTKLIEAKTENSINRITGVATNPRQTERVVSGVTFAFLASLRRFEGDEDLLSLLFDGLRLIELDALGGSGSRGYGKVKFQDMTVEGELRTLPSDPFASAA